MMDRPENRLFHPPSILSPTIEPSSPPPFVQKKSNFDVAFLLGKKKGKET